jgi:Arc/MetJ family transcription regulator
MTTNLILDDDLLALAQKVGGLKTKKATVNAALKEFIQRHQREEISKTLRPVDYDPALITRKRERNDEGSRDYGLPKDDAVLLKYCLGLFFDTLLR